VTKLRIYQIDAFADSVFRGNPAAVCLLSSWLPDALLQEIAAENNLSETAFVIPHQDPAPLRWFTPRHEVPLCGHATLAAGHVILTFVAPERESVIFTTPSGDSRVSRSGEKLTLNLPVVPFERVREVPIALTEGLGVESHEVLRSASDPNYLVILRDESEIRAVEPDLRRLESLHPHGVAISALGTSADFVSRYFAPSYGIPEDPVTGSIHCALAPYWAERLHQTTMTASQLSRRGGRLGIELHDDRVALTGSAICYLQGQICVV